jgi:hypothetical protein
MNAPPLLPHDPDDPDWLEYLIDTGNGYMIGMPFTDYVGQMIVLGFARWKRNRDYDEREKEAKKKLAP